MDSNNY
jgi:O-phospho-L-seryl-tRNASec:L-selenocysteinyl-tRNA synthase